MSYGPSPFQPAPPAGTPGPAGSGLHPMTIGRVFELTWRMYRFRWRALVGAAAVLLIPALVLQAAVDVTVSGTLGAWFGAFEQWGEQFDRIDAPGAAPELPPLPPLPAGFWEAIALSIGVGLLNGVISVLAFGAVVYGAGRIYANESVTAGEAVREAIGNVLSLVGAQLLRFVAVLAILVVGFGVGFVLMAQGPGLVAFLGLILLVSAFVGLVFLMLRWTFAEQAIMLEARGAPDGLGRSWKLVAGSMWRVLGYLLLLSLLIGLIALVVGTFIGLLLTGGRATSDGMTIALQTALVGVFTILATPFTAIFFTLLYYDIRWRRGEFGAPVQSQGYQPYADQPPYGQPPYGQPPYGQPPYGESPPAEGPPVEKPPAERPPG